jgi:carboxypeptidase Q
MRRFPLFFLLACTVALTSSSILFAQGMLLQREKIDSTAIAQIKIEEMSHSQVMEILSYLTDVYGPRLTGSPEFKQAADWASAKLRQWGVQNVHYEKWGPFGKGWTLKRFSANVTKPRAFPLIAYPKAWSPGIRGTVEGDVIYLNARSDSELATFKGKLDGKFVLISDPRDLKAHFLPAAVRLADSTLLKLANADVPEPGQQRRRFPPLYLLSPAARDSAMRAIMRRYMPDADSAALERAIVAQIMLPKKLGLCVSEGAAAVLDEGRGDDGTLFVQAATVPQPPGTPYGQRINPYNPDAPKLVPQVTVAAEQYNRMIRMIEKGQKLEMEMELDVQSTPVDSAFNIIGEIPGTDLKDEVVMIGGHFDSWHAGTGATDNGTGSAVCMEAMRIFEAIGLKPRRTIRIGLWGGEEEGLLGSRAYVSRHFGEREGGLMAIFSGGVGEVNTKPEYEKFSVYFNNDNGTGEVRGVYMQGNEAARPIFRAWLEPFENMGASTLSPSNTGGTDHLSFDAIGLPSFQFIQDPIDYDTRTHHTNMDVYDRAQEEDLKQAAAIMASFAYNAAMRDEKFPRKPMPKPAAAPASQ